MNLSNYSYANPELFWIFLVIPILVFYYFLKHRSTRLYISIPFSDIDHEIKPTWKERLIHLPFIIRIISFILIIFILARPRSSSVGSEVNTEGIDIVLAIDISASMLAEDFKPNRIEAAKNVAKDFILSRKNDRIGLVIFSGESYTQCPTTTDHNVLLNTLTAVKSGMLEDGTAIGEGLATAVSRLKDSDSKSKVVILLTDGVNNLGSVSPETAGDIAKSFGIRVYSVGVGTNGLAPYPVQTPFGKEYQRLPVQIDEVILKKIAATTDGKYFRATNNTQLTEVYSEIDKMEKTKIRVEEWRSYTDMFKPFLLLTIFLLGFELLFQHLILRRIP